MRSIHTEPTTRPALAKAGAVLAVVAAGAAAGGVFTLTPAGEAVLGVISPEVVTCAPATWLLDTDANPTTGDPTTAGSTVYTVQVLKSPCYALLTGGDTPHDAWVGGVATEISEHTTSWRVLQVAPDYSTVTVSSTLTEAEMHTALEEVTGYVEWGVWEALRAEETGEGQV